MSFNRSRVTVSLIGVTVAIAAVACGGGSSDEAPGIAAPAADSPTATAATATPAIESATAVAQQPTAAPIAPTTGSQPSPTATAPPVTPTPIAAATPVAPGTPVASAAGTFTWTIEDVDRGTKPALALSSAGVPYIAYMLEAQNGFVKNAILNGSAWDIATVAEGYFYGPLDIAIGPDDVPHISYHDHQAAGFEPDLGDAAYAVLASGQWRVEAVFHQGHDGWDNRIVIDPQGRPHFSAIDPVDFGGLGVEYYFLDDSGEWTVETIGTGPLTYKYATSIAVDPQGNPHITYHDQKNDALALGSRDDSGWTLTTVDDNGETGLFSSLVIDQDGRFHISYMERTGDNSGVIRYATRATGETAWDIRDVDVLTNLKFGFVGARNVTSVALDSKGGPVVAYSDEKLLRLALWDGSEWRIDNVVDAGSDTLGQLVSLELDSQDRPHIAYFQVTDKTPLDGVVKYALGTRATAIAGSSGG